ncbi:DUF6249 domain-containing protein [Mucilaginibacter sp. UR6-11]|uniref:DUF6249 domain-containing protein n=1 Tax=Mucilaginibacter sp. UR6-11 TaxID=1435644 RepID=UPI001E3BFDE9|nr:DUF6249 domain-containing protein [Mucilaginibacter sp. UR6-11]MCC8424631.1 hypothetical protein [Mucilaginibacter sp. UR6-11]
MQEVTRDAIVSITLFAAVFGMVYVFLMTRHRERMNMLERNLTIPPFPKTNYNLATLKYGMFLVGIAIGFLMGSVLHTYCEIEEGISYISMVCLFGGFSLILSYIIIKKQKQS